MKSCRNCGGAFAQPLVGRSKFFCCPRCASSWRAKQPKTPEQLEKSRAANRKCARKNRAKRQAHARLHAEDKRAYNKAYREMNRERLLAADLQRNIRNRDKRAAYMRKYNARPEVKLRTQLWYASTRSRRRVEHRVWRAANRALLHSLQREARKRRKERGGARPLTLAEIELRRSVFVRDNWTCQICGRETYESAEQYAPNSPVLDHVIPLSRGGEHRLTNLQCACWECNAVKKNKLPEEMTAFRVALSASEGKPRSTPE